MLYNPKFDSTTEASLNAVKRKELPHSIFDAVYTTAYSPIYIEDITCLCVDTNFTFKWSTWYLTSERSEWVRYRVEHEKVKFASISEYVIFCLLYKQKWNTKSACFQRRDLLCNHNDGDLFTCEDNMLSSCVKIWSFRGKSHLVFHWCLYNKLWYSLWWKANTKQKLGLWCFMVEI